MIRLIKVKLISRIFVTRKFICPKPIIIKLINRRLIIKGFNKKNQKESSKKVN